MSILVLYLLDWAIGNAMRAITSVFWFTSVSLGGWGFSIRQISLLSGATGVIGIIWSIFFYPATHAWAGTKRILEYCGIILVALQFWAIASNQLLRQGKYVIFLVFLPLFSALQSIMSCSSNGKEFPAERELPCSNVVY